MNYTPKPIVKEYIWGVETWIYSDDNILIKLIDAKQNLSVQVHPNDEQAAPERGKTEMWYIIEALPNAEIIYGFNRKITREEFRERIEKGTLLEVVNRIKVKKGDVFFVPAGTIHAIGAGILIAEVQQNSDITYRVYDYGRVDPNGNPRELHIEKAIQVTDLNPPIQPYNRTSCEYFDFKRLNIDGVNAFNIKGAE